MRLPVDEKFRGFYVIGGGSIAIRNLVEVDDEVLVRNSYSSPATQMPPPTDMETQSLHRKTIK